MAKWRWVDIKRRKHGSIIKIYDGERFLGFARVIKVPPEEPKIYLNVYMSEDQPVGTFDSYTAALAALLHAHADASHEHQIVPKT